VRGPPKTHVGWWLCATDVSVQLPYCATASAARAEVAWCSEQAPVGGWQGPLGAWALPLVDHLGVISARDDGGTLLCSMKELEGVRSASSCTGGDFIERIDLGVADNCRREHGQRMVSDADHHTVPSACMSC